MADPQQTIIDACSKHFQAHKNNCSGFVRAVARDLGYELTGNADSIVEAIDAKWIKITTGAAAAAAAAGGAFVIAGLTSSAHVPKKSHGHVVVVVGGELYRGTYPKCWGGSLGGDYASDGTKSIGQVWGKKSRDKVLYRRAPSVSGQGSR